MVWGCDIRLMIWTGLGLDFCLTILILEGMDESFNCCGKDKNDTGLCSPVYIEQNGLNDDRIYQLQHVRSCSA